MRDDRNMAASGWTADDAVIADLRSWLVERGFVVVRDHYAPEPFGNQEVILTRPIAVRLVRDRNEWRVDLLGGDGQWTWVRELREELRGPGPHLASATDQAEILREILPEVEDRAAR